MRLKTIVLISLLQASIGHSHANDLQLECQSTDSVDYPHFTARFSGNEDSHTVYATTRRSRYRFVEANDCEFINQVMIVCSEFTNGNDGMVETVRFFRKMPGSPWKAQIKKHLSETARLECKEL